MGMRVCWGAGARLQQTWLRSVYSDVMCSSSSRVYVDISMAQGSPSSRLHCW